MAPIFDYKAFSSDGKTLRGSIDAENSKAARAKLKKQRLMVTEITEKSVKGAKGQVNLPFVGNKVGLRDVTLMTRQLASLVKSNIPLVEALRAMVDQTENERLKVILDQIKNDVNEGSSLANALKKHPKAFDHIFINMIEAGESSGTLGLVMIKLADLKEAQMRLRGKIINGMTYPALMMVVGIALMIAIFVFMIPKITEIFESMNKAMPPLTIFMIQVSDFITQNWMIILGAMVAGFLFFKRYINTDSGRYAWDGFKLKLPIFGSLIRFIAVTRFSNTMGTLLQSGVPILTSMSIARNLVGNVLIANAVGEARENITEGQSIADPLRKSGEFPPMVIHMIAIGEKTGELPEMLQNVAETYEEQVNSKIEGLTALLEPIMIIGMGMLVAFIVVSIFIPLLDMSNLE